jgi:hypothetical protein
VISALSFRFVGPFMIDLSFRNDVCHFKKGDSREGTFDDNQRK